MSVKTLSLTIVRHIIYKATRTEVTAFHACVMVTSIVVRIVTSGWTEMTLIGLGLVKVACVTIV